MISFRSEAPITTYVLLQAINDTYTLHSTLHKYKGTHVHMLLNETIW